MDGEGLRYVAPELSRSFLVGHTFSRFVSLGAKSLPTFWATFGGVRVCSQGPWWPSRFRRVLPMAFGSSLCFHVSPPITFF